MSSAPATHPSRFLASRSNSCDMMSCKGVTSGLMSLATSLAEKEGLHCQRRVPGKLG